MFYWMGVPIEMYKRNIVLVCVGVFINGFSMCVFITQQLLLKDESKYVHNKKPTPNEGQGS